MRTQELFLYDEYPVAFMMHEVFGFGKPLDHQPIMAMPGVQSGTWAGPVMMVADALGVTLDRIRETYEVLPTPRRLEVASGVIEAGTVGAVRFETIGVVDGEDAIVIEHVNRMAADLAPEWPTAERDGTYRIVVEGSPSYQCELVFGQPGTSSAEGMVATAMRIVNAVPRVCDADPGLVSSLDLPLTLPVDPFRVAARRADGPGPVRTGSHGCRAVDGADHGARSGAAPARGVLLGEGSVDELERRLDGRAGRSAGRTPRWRRPSRIRPSLVRGRRSTSLVGCRRSTRRCRAP